jgi:hypothetical protein
VVIQGDNFTPRESEITTLKIKTDQGQKIIARLRYDDTFKTLRSLLDPYLRYNTTNNYYIFKRGIDYELRGGMPSKPYSFSNQTFRSAGLIPNGTLWVRKLQH